MQRFRLGLAQTLCILALLVPWAATAADETFGDDQLDQMLAPIALHPDALLSQMLMASTYPLDVADAVKWSAAHKDMEGDAAVAAVESEAWDPSVKSLVAFPQVLAMMGEKPEWVQELGDAFLAEPDKMMDRVQYLRTKAEGEGNLKSTEQQTVKHEDAQPQPETTTTTTEAAPSTTVVVEQAPPQTIIIEQTNPQVVYVPSYNPTVIYGPWWWPRLRPWYWRPYGWGFGGAVARGIGFGIGVGITNSLWGGFNWGRGNVDINVNRYNNINVNNKINSNNWNHNSDRRRTPYKDKGSREKYGNKGDRGRGDDFRGKDHGRDASRDRAQKTLADRGADPKKGRDQLKNDPKTRDRAQQAAKRDGAGGDRAGAKAGDRAGAGKASPARADRQKTERSQAKQSHAGKSSGSKSRDNAFKGSGSSKQSHKASSRGKSSRSHSKSRGGGGHRGGGGGGRRR